MRPPEYAERSKTGRVRPRAGWFGKYVMEIEVRVDVYSAIPAPPRNPDTGTEWSNEAWKKECYLRSWLEWRDANRSDFEMPRHIYGMQSL